MYNTFQPGKLHSHAYANLEPAKLQSVLLWVTSDVVSTVYFKSSKMDAINSNAAFGSISRRDLVLNLGIHHIDGATTNHDYCKDIFRKEELIKLN